MQRIWKTPKNIEAKQKLRYSYKKMSANLENTISIESNKDVPHGLTKHSKSGAHAFRGTLESKRRKFAGCEGTLELVHTMSRR